MEKDTAVNRDKLIALKDARAEDDDIPDVLKELLLMRARARELTHEPVDSGSAAAYAKVLHAMKLTALVGYRGPEADVLRADIKAARLLTTDRSRAASKARKKEKGR